MSKKTQDGELTPQFIQADKMAALGLLVAGVAHEINTPMGAIHSNNDNMRRAVAKIRKLLGPQEQEVERLFDIVDEVCRNNEAATERIMKIVHSLKNFARLDEAERKEVDIHEGIESTLTMLGHKLKNVTLIRAFDRSVPRIMAYGSELNQVWTNLIDNAIAAVNGTGKICVGTSLEDDQLVVEIVDNGAGIPPEVQAHMFEPFFTTKSVGTGTGLGLVISNRIVGDRHGGEIEFESKPGETRFKVRLPVNRKP